MIEFSLEGEVDTEPQIVRKRQRHLGTDLSVHTAEDLAQVGHSLNNRPRETLGYMKS